MKLPQILSDIASNTPAFTTNLINTEFSTATEAVIRLAAAKNNSLFDPPAAFFHPSNIPNASILYGGSLDPPFDDVKYTQGASPPFDSKPDQVFCVGGCVVDVCESESRPAILYAYFKPTGGLVVRMVVYDCPMATMEAELFGGKTSAFESAWSGDASGDSRKFLDQVHTWMRSRGPLHFPPFLYDREATYHLVRKGVLPFLRARSPSNDKETNDLKSMLEALDPPAGNITPLKRVAQVSSDDAGNVHGGVDGPISLETVFVAAPVGESAGRVGPIAGAPCDEVDYGSDGSDAPEKLKGCAQAASFPALGVLAMCILRGTTEDYDDEVEAEVPTIASSDLDKAIDEEENSSTTHRGLTVDTEQEVSATHPLLFATPLQKTCDSALIVSSPDQVIAACGVVSRCGSDEDAGLIAEHLALLKPGTLVAALSHVASHSHRQGFLVCYPKSKILVINTSTYKITDDAARRLLLQTWVTPLMVRYERVSEIKLKGVGRETVEVTASFRRQVISSRTSTIPESMTILMQDVASRLGALEQAVQAAPAPVPAAPAPAPAAPAPVPAALAPAPLPAPSPQSAAGKSFKRVLALLSMAEESNPVAKRA